TYISKIPSFRIEDLAQAMLPGCRIKEIGIREGEKLHEIMITRDDSRMTYEYEKHYIIYPNFEWMKLEPDRIGLGRLVEEGFEYHSGENKEWLDIEALKKELERIV
ncbi:MAG: polysaccharide biosynthesis protein, partial [Acetivibrio ethanolgignens]